MTATAALRTPTAAAASSAVSRRPASRRRFNNALRRFTAAKKGNPLAASLLADAARVDSLI
jgi:hypothetical protein